MIYIGGSLALGSQHISDRERTSTGTRSQLTLQTNTTIYLRVVSFLLDFVVLLISDLYDHILRETSAASSSGDLPGAGGALSLLLLESFRFLCTD